MDDQSPLCNSNRLLVAIGKAYYFNGDRKNALIYLQRVSNDLNNKLVQQFSICNSMLTST